jgi:hypothetical protein
MAVDMRKPPLPYTRVLIHHCFAGKEKSLFDRGVLPKRLHGHDLCLSFMIYLFALFSNAKTSKQQKHFVVSLHTFPILHIQISEKNYALEDANDCRGNS